MRIRSIISNILLRLIGDKYSSETKILDYIDFPKIDYSFQKSKEYKEFMSYRYKKSMKNRKYFTPTIGQWVFRNYGYIKKEKILNLGIDFVSDSGSKVVAPETSIIINKGIKKNIEYLLLYGLDTECYHLLANIKCDLKINNKIIKAGDKVGTSKTNIHHAYCNEDGWVNPAIEFYEEYANKLFSKFINFERLDTY